MKMIHAACAAAVLVATSIGTAMAADGKTLQDEPYVSGGVGVEEREALQRGQVRGEGGRRGRGRAARERR